MPQYIVVDTKDVQPGQQCPILGRFYSTSEAARFISTLPENETGRYGLDGPAETEDPEPFDEFTGPQVCS